MISTKNLVVSWKEIPDDWIFSYYCKVPLEAIRGGDIKIRSMFSTTDRTPSFSIYHSGTRIKFNDFSSGKKGSALDLVMMIGNISFVTACARVIADYNRWIIEGGEYEKGEDVVYDKFRVTSHVPRSFNVLDRDYWTSFYLGSNILSWGFVKAIESYTMSKGSEQFTIEGDYIYGYYDSKGSLKKIYQPKNKEHKFIVVDEYFFGEEHKGGYEVCVLASSWKDALCLKLLGLRLDVRVPKSENTILEKLVIDQLKREYKFLILIFDNDEAGHKAAERYKELYDIDAAYILLDDIKDIAEVVQKKAPPFAREYFTILINKKINQNGF